MNFAENEGSILRHEPSKPRLRVKITVNYTARNFCEVSTILTEELQKACNTSLSLSLSLSPSLPPSLPALFLSLLPACSLSLPKSYTVCCSGSQEPTTSAESIASCVHSRPMARSIPAFCVQVPKVQILCLPWFYFWFWIFTKPLVTNRMELGSSNSCRC